MGGRRWRRYPRCHKHLKGKHPLVQEKTQTSFYWQISCQSSAKCSCSLLFKIPGLLRFAKQLSVRYPFGCTAHGQFGPTMCGKSHLTTCGDLTTKPCWAVAIHFAGSRFTSESQIAQGVKMHAPLRCPDHTEKLLSVCFQKQLKEKSTLVQC